MRAMRVSAGVLVSLFALSACTQVPVAPPVDPRTGESMPPVVSGELTGVDDEMSVLFLGDVVRGIGRAAGSVVEKVGDVAGGVVGAAEDAVGSAGRVVGGLVSDVAETATRPLVGVGNRVIHEVGRYLDRRAASAVQQPKPVRSIGKRLPPRGEEVGLNPQPLPPRDRRYIRDRRYLRDRSPGYYPDQRRYDRPSVYRPYRPSGGGYDRDFDRYDRRYEGSGRYDRGYGDYDRGYVRYGEDRYDRRYEPQGSHWGNYQPYYQDAETWSPPRRRVMQDEAY